MHEKISRWVQNYMSWVTRACFKDLETIVWVLLMSELKITVQLGTLIFLSLPSPETDLGMTYIYLYPSE